MVGVGHFLAPLAPLVRFSRFRKTHFFERNFGRRLGLKKLHFCTPWKGPKFRFVTKRLVKLQFPLWRLGPKRALCKSTWAAEGPLFFLQERHYCDIASEVSELPTPPSTL